jgi:hypothetical protein
MDIIRKRLDLSQVEKPKAYTYLQADASRDTYLGGRIAGGILTTYHEADADTCEWLLRGDLGGLVECESCPQSEASTISSIVKLSGEIEGFYS